MYSTWKDLSAVANFQSYIIIPRHYSTPMMLMKKIFIKLFSLDAMEKQENKS